MRRRTMRRRQRSVRRTRCRSNRGNKAWSHRAGHGASGAEFPRWHVAQPQLNVQGLDRLLAALQQPGRATPYRARALLAAGTLAGHLLDAQRAGALLHESHALARQLGELGGSWGAGMAQRMLGWTDIAAASYGNVAVVSLDPVVTEVRVT